MLEAPQQIPQYLLPRISKMDYIRLCSWNKATAAKQLQLLYSFSSSNLQWCIILFDANVGLTIYLSASWRCIQLIQEGG